MMIKTRYYRVLTWGLSLKYPFLEMTTYQNGGRDWTKGFDSIEEAWDNAIQYAERYVKRHKGTRMEISVSDKAKIIDIYQDFGIMKGMIEYKRGKDLLVRLGYNSESARLALKQWCGV